MTTRNCSNPDCKASNPAAAPFCGDCNAKLPTVAVHSKFASPFGDFAVLAAVPGDDPICSAFVIHDKAANARFLLKEFFPPPSADGAGLKAFAQLAARLEQAADPGVIAPLKHFAANNRLYTVEPLVSGTTLAQEQARVGRLDEVQVLEVAAQVAATLVRLHGLRPALLHGEVTPANILRRASDGRLLLKDFGSLRDASQVIRSNGQQELSTRHLAAYMPAERALGKLGPASDVYGLGLTMLSLLSGQPPGDLFDELSSQWRMTGWSMSDSTRALITVLTKNVPDERLQEIAQAQTILREIAGGGTFDEKQVKHTAEPKPQPKVKVPVQPALTLCSECGNSTQPGKAICKTCQQRRSADDLGRLPNRPPAAAAGRLQSAPPAVENSPPQSVEQASRPRQEPPIQPAVAATDPHRWAGENFKARLSILVEDITRIHAQDFGNHLLIRWEWPEGCTRALVAWRADFYPQNAQDPGAEKRVVTRGEYDRVGGFRIDAPAHAPYHFVVFAAAEDHGQCVYSQGALPESRVALRLSPRITISYTISRHFWRRKLATIRFSADQDAEGIPEIIIVARQGDLQPQRMEHGKPVATFRDLRLPARGAVERPLSLDGLARPAYLRAFFREPSAYELFALADPPTDQLKVD